MYQFYDCLEDAVFGQWVFQRDRSKSNKKGQRDGRSMVGVEKDDDMGGNLHLDG